MLRSNKLFLLLVFGLGGCSVSPMVQPQINSLVAAEHYDYARYVLEEHAEAYGPNNSFLYYVDYGLLQHMAGEYESSILAFDKAKRIYTQNLPKSVSKYLESWVINDNRKPYQGAVYERLLINFFQALNFSMLSDFSAAQVEARDVDVQLRKLSSLQRSENDLSEANAFFARLFSGFVYALSNDPSNLTDALIDYEKVLKWQKKHPDDGLFNIPKFIREDIDVIKRLLHGDDADFKKRNLKGQLYVTHLVGLSPIKHQKEFIVPVFDGRVVKVAFSLLNKRLTVLNPAIVKLVNKESNKEIFSTMTPFIDITELALANQKKKVKYAIAKAVLRTGAKYAVSKAVEDDLREDYGNTTADIFKYASNAYSVFSENADLRSWQTLPSTIHMQRFIVEPGVYDVYIEGKLVAEDVLCTKGAKKFIVNRSNFAL
ncbi:MAG: hypothetical protein ACI9F2_000934 [Lysobacterales bacterium]